MQELRGTQGTRITSRMSPRCSAGSPRPGGSRATIARSTEFGTPDSDYYLLAGPRLAEAHDYCTTVPCTGADCSTPKPLTGSNLLYSQHQGDDQRKDDRSEPLDKTRLAKIASVHPTPPPTC